MFDVDNGAAGGGKDLRRRVETPRNHRAAGAPRHSPESLPAGEIAIGIGDLAGDRATSRERQRRSVGGAEIQPHPEHVGVQNMGAVTELLFRKIV